MLTHSDKNTALAKCTKNSGEWPAGLPDIGFDPECCAASIDTSYSSIDECTVSLSMIHALIPPGYDTVLSAGSLGYTS